jgi:hypothetical protein
LCTTDDRRTTTTHSSLLKLTKRQNKNINPRAALGPQRAALTVRSAVKEEKATKDSAARQMLGMKGAALETDKFKIRVQLTKPVTWVPLIWGALVVG